MPSKWCSASQITSAPNSSASAASRKISSITAPSCAGSRQSGNRKSPNFIACSAQAPPHHEPVKRAVSSDRDDATKRRMTRILRLLGLPIGIAIVAWLVMQADPAALFGAFPRIGWGFVAILVVRAATVVIDCGAWQCLLPGRGRPSFAVMLPLRWIAESINTTLPAAQIGGEVVRARLLQRRLDAPARGAASVAVDFCLSLLGQILFTLLGFGLVARLSAAAWWPAAIAALSVPLFAVFSWEMLVRRRLLAALEAWSARIGQRRLAGILQRLGAALALLAEIGAALAG